MKVCVLGGLCDPVMVGGSRRGAGRCCGPPHSPDWFLCFVRNRRVHSHHSWWTGTCDLDQTCLTGTCDLDLWGQGHLKVKGHAEPVFADFDEIW